MIYKYIIYELWNISKGRFGIPLSLGINFKMKETPEKRRETAGNGGKGLRDPTGTKVSGWHLIELTSDH